MRDDYKAARRLGEEAVREAKRKGVSPYPPVLDELPEIKSCSSEVRLGLLELPVRRITGNKETGRSSAFANNFMPLLDDDSEFALKWSNLYDSFLKEGIRDAIKVYEYMNNYYVQEGNKRVSVSLFGDVEFILADVHRILPKPDDSKEYKVYAEYLDFYTSTKNIYIVFTEPGSYTKLADLLGEELGGKWSESLCSELKWAFFNFSKRCRSVLKITDDRQLSDMFLMYISIFPMKTLCSDTEEQVIKNIKLASNELSAAVSQDNISFLDSAPEAETSIFKRKLFSGRKKYTVSAPLRAAFVYGSDPEESRFADSHESGRLYVDKMTGDNVVTSSYFDDDPAKAIEAAVSGGNEIIFAASPSLIPEALKAAVKNPSLKILCCSVGQSYSSIRYYDGKLYEATFLMGILAADRLLLEGGNAPRRIGYLARSRENFSSRDLNAFAVGVSLIDPEAKVLLAFSENSSEAECREKWKAAGVRYYADFDYSENADVMKRPGLYRMTDGRDEYIGVPYFSWGKYYVQIVQSVLSGAWELGEHIKSSSAANYWFGLSTGVVDIRVSDASYQTSKLLAFFKNSIVNGGFDPFSGELHTADGNVFQQDAEKKAGISVERQKLKSSDIAFMDWLNENIEGDEP
ncbi:MAG: hypothetical protein IJR91_03430 [Ruminococcus sp.]|nr:hypothetical protein [Ruminococcus sp.]